MEKIKEQLGICRLRTKDICVLAMFIALSIVFDIFFTVPVSNTLQITFSYIPIFVVAALYGPLWGGITYVIADAVGALLIYGSASPLLSLTAFLSGIAYGFFFYKRHTYSVSFIIRLIACVIVQFFISIVINTYFLTVMYHSIFATELIKRLPSSSIKAVVQIIVIYLSPYYLNIFKKYTE